MLRLTDDAGASVDLDPEVFTIAGYTGRDRVLVQAHIDELAHEGIPPPPEVPMYYRMPVSLLTTAPRIEVPSKQSCGECEPVVIGVGGSLYLGVGSDHTARDVEREDIAKSKRICPKPIGSTVARLSALGPELDAIAIESAMDGEPYQRGTLAAITPLNELLDGFRARSASTPFVLFCGTVPLLTGGFRFGARFSARLAGGPLRAPLTLEYTTTPGAS